jgi:hypothetical protein
MRYEGQVEVAVFHRDKSKPEKEDGVFGDFDGVRAKSVRD